jgi:hypothetical protein
MKTQHTFGVSIPKPCHENWDLMSPHEQGKYCMVCSKAVIDFTHMTDTEIIQTIQQSSKSICGRLDEQQLESLRPKYQLPKKMKVFLYALAVAFLIELPNEVFAQISQDTSSAQNIHYSEILGRVTNEKRQPLDFASVQVFDKGVTIGGAKTDINGNYKIKQLKSGIYSIKVTYAGYISKIIDNVNISDSDSLIKLNFTLKIKPQTKTTGDIIITVGKPRLINPSEPNKKVMTKSDLRNVTR